MAATKEFSRNIAIEPWPEGHRAVALEAGPAERQRLARRLDLVDLPALSAQGSLERSADGREICFRGRLDARVVQTCVVSLEPVAASISEPVERRFRLDESPSGVELVLDPEEVDWEPLEGDSLDLGEVVAEELSLALDPYPKAADAYALLPDLGPDVSVGPEPEDESPPAAEPEGESPFAVLQNVSLRNPR